MLDLKNKNLFGIKNPAWWTQAGDGCLLNVYYPAVASSYFLKDYFPTSARVTVCFVINKRFVWAYEAGDMLRISNLLMKQASGNRRYYLKLYQKWQRQIHAYNQLVNKINKLNLSRLSRGRVINLFEEFSKTYLQEYALPLLTDHYHGYSEKTLLPQILKFLKNISNKEKDKIYQILLQPTNPSFIKEAHWSVLKMAARLQQGQNIKSDLAQHTKNYYWLHNNYTCSQYLDENYWLKEVKKYIKKDCLAVLKKERADFKNIKKQKDLYIKKLNLDRQTALGLEILDHFSYWQDQRKQANMIANWIIDQFIRELSKRTKADYWLLKHLTPAEVALAFKTKKIDQELLRRRLKCSVVVVTPKSIDVLAYPKARQLYQRMFPKTDYSVKVIRGVVANQGKAQGRARVITSSRQFKNFKKGEILVASMTRPDYTVILNKATAIITDEGGLTCHAAIVSRELGIPCIIGTKIATKVLKSGDRIKVDANKGVIKKL